MRQRNKVLKGFSEVNLGYNAKRGQLLSLTMLFLWNMQLLLQLLFLLSEGVISLNPVDRTRVVDYLHCKGCGTLRQGLPRSVVGDEGSWLISIICAAVQQ